MSFDPFSKTEISDLVRVEKSDPQLRVKTRESVHKEFKERFSLSNLGEYARTMAAFANARGGYLIFGVTDSPRIAKGLTGKAKGQWEAFDSAKLTEGLNRLFSPELHWKPGYTEIEGKYLGLIYTFESEHKPVVAVENMHKVKMREGDIIYRYSGQSRRIKYPELRTILDEAKSKENQKLMKHFEHLLMAGASNVALLDFSKSTLTGSSGQSVLLDNEMLADISFIREGEFDEVAGTPTLKVVGEVVSAQTVAVGGKVVHQAVTTEDIIKDFLHQLRPEAPKEYLRQAAAGSTSIVPVHYYRKAANMSHDQLVDFIAAEQVRSPAKRRLLTSLDEPYEDPTPSDSQHPSTVIRKKYYGQILERSLSVDDDISSTNAAHIMEAFQWLSEQQICDLFEDLRKLALEIFEKWYVQASTVADKIRRAVTHLDKAMFREKFDAESDV